MEAARFARAPRLVSLGPRWSELLVAAAVSVTAGGVVAVTGDWQVTLALGAAAGFLVTGLLAPAAFLVLLLLTRPLLDSLSEEKLVGGLNAAGFLALLVVAIAVVRLAPVRSHLPRLAGVDAAFPALIGLSALAAVLALANYGDQAGTKPIAELARLGAMYAVYLLGSRFFPSREAVRTLFLVVGLSAVIPAIVGVYQWIAGIAPDSNVPNVSFERLNGTFFDPNAFGPYLAIAAVLLLALPRRDLAIWVRVAALTPILIALVGTYSRTGWLIFAVALVLLGMRRHKVVTVAACVVLAVALPLIPGFQDRVVRPDTVEASSGKVQPNSVKWRFLAWSRLMREYETSPVVGHGLRTTEIVNPTRAAATTDATPENPSGNVGGNPHSTVIRALVEGGPLLLGAWIALFAALIRGMWRLSRRASESRGASELRPYARILLVLWFMMAVEGIASGDIAGFTAALFALLALTGAVVGAFRASGAADSLSGARSDPQSHAVG